MYRQVYRERLARISSQKKKKKKKMPYCCDDQLVKSHIFRLGLKPHNSGFFSPPAWTENERYQFKYTYWFSLPPTPSLCCFHAILSDTVALTHCKV